MSYPYLNFDGYNNNTSNPNWQYTPSTTAPSYGRVVSTMPYQAQMQPRRDLPQVSGPESAKAYPINPGERIAVFDANEPVMYVVSKDDAGTPTVRIFDFKEREPQPPIQHDDIESLKAQVAELKQMIEGLV